METLSLRQRDDLLRFLHGEAWELLGGPFALTHFDLAHNHIYLTRENGAWQVAGFIDCAEAMRGPAEWDVVYLWFWTFSGDREAMQQCLCALYADTPPPARFARRCFAAALYTPSMGLLWRHFLQRGGDGESVVRTMTAFFFPEELFGPPG